MYPPSSSPRIAQHPIPKFVNQFKGFFYQLFSPRQHKKRLAFFCVGLCLVSLASPLISPADAQVTQATVQEILDGNQVFIQNRQAALNDIARQKQQVRTGNARAALLFNTGAVARLSANSVLQIGQCAQLKRGTILINGAVNACSSSITAGVRGTTYLLEVDESGNQQIKVLEGEVVVKRNTTPLEDFVEDDPAKQNDPSTNQSPNPPDKSPSSSNPVPKPTTNQTKPDPKVTPKSLPTYKQTTPKTPSTTTPVKTDPNPQPTSVPTQVPTQMPTQVNPSNQNEKVDEVILKAGEKVEVSDRGILGVVQELTENEFVGLLTGALFQGFTNQIPSLDKIRSVFNLRFPNINFPIPNLPSIPGLPSLPSLPSFPF